MDRRLELHARLESLEGVKDAWFQAPPNDMMTYPCILYVLDDIQTTFADDNPYLIRHRWQLTLMDHDPDSSIRDAVAALPSCRFERFYVAENINHFVFNIFF